MRSPPFMYSMTKYKRSCRREEKRRINTLKGRFRKRTGFSERAGSGGHQAEVQGVGGRAGVVIKIDRS